VAESVRLILHELGGPGVQAGSASWTEVVVDRGTHQWVGKPDQPLGGIRPLLEHVGGDRLLQGGEWVVEFSHLAGKVESTVVAEHGGGHHQSFGLG
jgi:hypothetical protein